ncbi:helix-turn-helix domain-containing protein [Vibrio gazogenes]|uniref:Bacteriophage CI repressor helix-turn-helix domain-containing protein n=1 Tax=Vibrio gazogenes DSM 21264 = NBRC 103151 TaxID=1123492 RepID=A0A1M4V9T5_VIBGA|nr:helix-turn-helix domain-containing protein [Vibrio gazogenes]USP15592.1 helix-turn-helix domain-containing protein [Vibrio gazogenes]SHE65714.1 Bacteriophage CI repressor helix-turn-helix domain-containing protein [Vibrio gazogenes DSM 21264] [Vibrio gazogenes DSM 21264 = NBRC 103151]SJN57137.1 Bacteriophage CI repressor helix-turn-helix domain protein [Vibrio gazogenes]
MNKKQVLLPTIDYQLGKQVTDRIREVLDIKSVRALAENAEISYSTITTWHQRNSCPFDLAIRSHLHKGVSLKWLLLGEGTPYPNAATHAYQGDNNEVKKLIEIDLFWLKNGKLVQDGTITLEQFLLDELSITNVIAVREEGHTYIVDQEAQQAVSGSYLIDFDGLYSVNDIQRLPEKQLAIDFKGSPLVVAEDTLKVSGKVVLRMSRG